MLVKIKVALQYMLPKRWITKIVGLGAEYRGGWITRKIVTFFVYYYKINMQEAKQSDVSSYNTFNEFFTRPLRNEARPIDKDPSVIVFPADGIISQISSITNKQELQAKRHHYSLEALLAGNQSMISQFYNGSFINIYLSPGDYHRVHMPCNGILQKMIYVPGKLFSVNPLIEANIPNLLALNERIICLFETDFGPVAQILVGAAIVGSIETVWAGTITPPRKIDIKLWSYPKKEEGASKAISLSKGEEMGRFKLGSTVITLFSKNTVILEKHLHTQYITRMGQRLALGTKRTDNN